MIADVNIRKEKTMSIKNQVTVITENWDKLFGAPRCLRYLE